MIRSRIRAALMAVAAGLVVSTLAAPSLARAEDAANEAPQFVPLDPDEVDISDAEIFGRNSGPVYGERMVVEEDEDNVLILSASPRLDPRPTVVAGVEIFDPQADETAPENLEQAERDLYAEAEELFRSLHDNDIDISGVEIFDPDAEPVVTEAPVSEERLAVVAPTAGPVIAPDNAPDVAPGAQTEIELSAEPVLRPVREDEADVMDVAEVEIFELDEDPKAEEMEAREEAAEIFAGAEEAIVQEQDVDVSTVEMASIRGEPGPVVEVIDRSVGNRGNRNTGFDSRAFPGHYAGVGSANGMRLELETNGISVHGWLVDSAGQVFTIGGEINTLEGHAQAAVVSNATAIGYLDLQLTNLGLGALYVPLAEDLSPEVEDARHYEFLRALSSEAQAALAMERAERLAIHAGQPNLDRRRRRVVWQEEEDVWD